MTYLILALALTSNAIANILLKMGSEQFVQGLKEVLTQPLLIIKNGYLFGGLVFFAVALVLYAIVLSKMNLSVAYPIMTSMGFVIVVTFSVLHLKEQLFWWQWIGLVLIVAGVILLSRGTVA